MPFFVLGVTRYRAFDGTFYEESVSIQKETERAMLVQITKRGQTKEHWLPKSCCSLRTRPKIRIIDGQPQTVGEQQELVVKDWFWEKEILGVR